MTTESKTLEELKEEYQLSLSYLEELKNVYNKDGSLDTKNKREALVITVWKDLVEKAISQTGDPKEVYGVVARDFQRFFTSYRRYADILQSMWESKGKEKYSELIRKIVDFDFFENIFHEDSNNFFKLRGWASTTLKDKELIRKINSHLDCIVVSLFRQLKRRYGLG